MPSVPWVSGLKTEMRQVWRPARLSVASCLEMAGSKKWKAQNGHKGS